MIYIIIVIFLIIFYYINMNYLTVSKYKIKSDKIKDNIRIVHLSDIHNKQFGRDNVKLLNKIDSLSPDVIVITGDIIYKYNNKYGKMFELLNLLGDKYKVIAVLGNHELQHKRSKEVIDKIKDTNITILDNESIDLNDIYLTGITYDKKLNYKFNNKDNCLNIIKSKINNIDTDKFNLLLVHNPLIFKVYDELKYDLILSGHVHGGLIRIFNLGIFSPENKFFPKYSKGLYTGENSNIIVSSGLGNSKLKIRLFNLPEIVCIDLKNRKE